MAVSIAQYVDLLFKKLQGVAKTANATVKGASNESIASPAFIRGDVVWTESDQIGNVAGAISGIANARTGTNAVECVGDTTVPPVGGVRPTWLTNVPYWISQEFGSTWLPKVYVGPSGAANIEATGTQIFAAGISGTGEYYFDTQAGVLNFIGETIPSVLTAGNVIYVSGYVYSGLLGVTNLPDISVTGNVSVTGNITGNNITANTSAVLGNITIVGTNVNSDANVTIQSASNGNIDILVNGTGAVNFTNLIVDGTQITSDAGFSVTTNGNGNIVLTPDGDGVVQIVSTTALTVPVGNTAQRPASPDQGAVRFNTINLELEVWDGTQWETVGADIAVVTDQTLNGDGSTVNFVLDQEAYANAIIVSTNGVVQKPNVSYTVAGNVLTFAEAPAISDLIDVRFIAEVEQVTAISNSAGNASIQVDPSGVGNLSTVKSVQLPAYSVAQATALSNTANGQIIYVSDGDSGAPCLAVYSVNAWKILSLGGNITT